MIMLHHPIAFPPHSWNNYVALPRDCSAQTCELAAIETSNIVDKFLTHTPIPFVNAQFAFCAYVAAKSLLFDHQVTGRPLRSEFQRLKSQLFEMSDRWRGKRDASTQVSSTHEINQAGMYARHLESLLDTCQQSPQSKFDFYDHSCNHPGTQQYASPVTMATPQHQPRPMLQKRPSVASHVRQNSFTSTQSALSPRGMPSTNMAYVNTLSSPVNNTHSNNYTQPVTRPLQPPYPQPHSANGYIEHNQAAYDVSSASQLQPVHGAINQSVQDQSLLTLSDTFMDSQFLDMDRVITFEDANFFMPYGDM